MKQPLVSLDQTKSSSRKKYIILGLILLVGSVAAINHFYAKSSTETAISLPVGADTAPAPPAPPTEAGATEAGATGGGGAEKKKEVEETDVTAPSQVVYRMQDEPNYMPLGAYYCSAICVPPGSGPDREWSINPATQYTPCMYFYGGTTGWTNENTGRHIPNCERLRLEKPPCHCIPNEAQKRRIIREKWTLSTDQGNCDAFCVNRLYPLKKGMSGKMCNTIKGADRGIRDDGCTKEACCDDDPPPMALPSASNQLKEQ